LSPTRGVPGAPGGCRRGRRRQARQHRDHRGRGRPPRQGETGTGSWGAHPGWQARGRHHHHRRGAVPDHDGTAYIHYLRLGSLEAAFGLAPRPPRGDPR